MNKNHFYIAYAGNKRCEVKKIYDELNLEGITTIIEPFCGSCAISYYIWTLHPNLNFVLNDNNKYLKEMYEIIKNNKINEFEKKINEDILPNVKTKENYDKFLKDNKELTGWFIANKYYNIRNGLFPKGKVMTNINLKSYPITEFFQKAKILFTNDDGIDCYSKYSNSKNNLLILDPPYLSVCNDFYHDSKTNVYEYIYNNPINKSKAKIIFILEDNWIIKLLFKNYVKNTYEKLYQTSKKKTNHLIINNFKKINNIE